MFYLYTPFVDLLLIREHQIKTIPKWHPAYAHTDRQPQRSTGYCEWPSFLSKSIMFPDIFGYIYLAK